MADESKEQPIADLYENKSYDTIQSLIKKNGNIDDARKELDALKNPKFIKGISEEIERIREPTKLFSEDFISKNNYLTNIKPQDIKDYIARAQTAIDGDDDIETNSAIDDLIKVFDMVDIDTFERDVESIITTVTSNNKQVMQDVRTITSKAIEANNILNYILWLIDGINQNMEFLDNGIKIILELQERILELEVEIESKMIHISQLIDQKNELEIEVDVDERTYYKEKQLQLF